MLEKTEKKGRRPNGEGCIYQLKDGTWSGSIQRGYKPDGKPNRPAVSGSTKAECAKALRELKKKLDRDDYVVVKKMTIEDYMTQWLTTVKINELKPKAYDRLEGTVNNQIIPHVGRLQVASFTADDLQRLINKLSNEMGYSYSTVKKVYDAFNDCFRTGVIRRSVLINPAISVVVPQKIQVAKSDDDFDDKLHFYNDDEIERLIKAATEKLSNGADKYRYGDIVPLAIYTGMRVAELLGLKWRNVDMEQRIIKVVDTLVVVKNRQEGAETKNVFLDQKSTKTHAGRRKLAINDKAYEALLRLHKITGEGLYVFETQTHRPVCFRNIDRMIRNCCHTAGFPPERTFGMHALRHTFASKLFAVGEDVKTVSELLGHSDVTVTYNVYIHLIEEQKNLAIHKIVNF